MRLFFIVPALFSALCGFSQENFKWWAPQSDTSIEVVEGRCRRPVEGDDFYGRIPAALKPELRPAVWLLSQQSAGLLIRFRTNATVIHVRYQTEGAREMPHMPATGVSGVDLYALGPNGQWQWPGISYSFKDTIQYYFNALSNDGEKEYHLYLPLYSQLKWLEVGVPVNTSFTPLPARKEKPVVVYGTSIAQGGCASRPGMAWTAILGRKLHQPVINLGFSGNGLLEAPVVDLMAEVDADLFILDCFPNMMRLSPQEIQRRLKEAVNSLRARHPKTPIIITEHADANIFLLNTGLHQQLSGINATAKAAFSELVSAGLKDIYYLTAEEIHLDTDATVDGIHPTDLGMLAYADAYYRKIQSIRKN